MPHTFIGQWEGYNSQDFLILLNIEEKDNYLQGTISIRIESSS